MLLGVKAIVSALFVDLCLHVVRCQGDSVSSVVLCLHVLRCQGDSVSSVPSSLSSFC